MSQQSRLAVIGCNNRFNSGAQGNPRFNRILGESQAHGTTYFPTDSEEVGRVMPRIPPGSDERARRVLSVPNTTRSTGKVHFL